MGDPSSSHYRAAIALSNTAVSLLERGSYQQAHETIQDAVVFLKLSYHGPLPSGLPLHIADKRTSRDFAAMMRRAGQSLSRPDSSSSRTSGFTVVSVSDDADSVEMESALGRCTFEDPVVFPIRIESFSWTESLTDMEASLVCATVLHNFGLSCLCRSKTVTAEGEQSLLETSLKIFEVCQWLLSSRSSCCKDHYQLRKLFFLGYTVVSTLVQAMNATGRDKDAMHYLEKLMSLRAGVRELGCPDVAHHERDLAAAA